MIDVPGMQVVQVLPGRFTVVCRDRFPPQLQFINKVVYTDVVAQCFFEIPLLPYTWWPMSLLHSSCRTFLSLRGSYSPWCR